MERDLQFSKMMSPNSAKNDPRILIELPCGCSKDISNDFVFGFQVAKFGCERIGFAESVREPNNKSEKE
jgi:hypothetical protein